MHSLGFESEDHVIQVYNHTILQRQNVCLLATFTNHAEKDNFDKDEQDARTMSTIMKLYDVSISKTTSQWLLNGFL